MDVVGKALLCVTLVYVLNEIVRRKLPKVWDKGDLFIALAVGVGIVWLVGATVWGRTELIAGVSLSDMNGAEHIVAGLLIGAASVGFDLLLGRNSVVRDIGIPLPRTRKGDPPLVVSPAPAHTESTLPLASQSEVDRHFQLAADKGTPSRD